MKVLLLNGSPHENGTTMRALKEVERTLQENGIETEIISIGLNEVSGCTVCGACKKTGYCIKNDFTNVVIDKLEASDGFIVGTPVYYAGLNGTLKSLLDKTFYAHGKFVGKPAAAVACARRAGTSFTLDIINKYFMISEMPVISSQYWNNVYGANAEDAEKDLEGLQTMRVLANNMAYILKCIEAGKKAGITPPEKEPRKRTNFIGNN